MVPGLTLSSLLMIMFLLWLPESQFDLAVFGSKVDDYGRAVKSTKWIDGENLTLFIYIVF